MKTVCEKNMCTGCMACVDICPKNAISIYDDLSSYNAVIDTNNCVECGFCTNVCQNNSIIEVHQPVQWYQGWSNNDLIRAHSSSGGAAAELSRTVINMGGIVCSCKFENGKFSFSFAETIEQLEAFSGSKYVKSDPSGIYNKIKEFLSVGRIVLFISLPCQVAALKKYIPARLQETLYTADLICHGTPSPKLLQLFLNQYGRSLETTENLQFRIKNRYQLFDNYKGIITNGVSDRYLIAFLNSLTFTENCYSCKYARHERVGDITLGDSWGSHLPNQEKAKGVSLILCQNARGLELLGKADIHVEYVDKDMALQNNGQLNHATKMPATRKRFFEGIRQTNFNRIVSQCLPKQCFRQDVKELLIKAKIIHREIQIPK